jgi:two-component system, sensor histidine kinase PdtaS
MPSPGRREAKSRSTFDEPDDQVVLTVSDDGIGIPDTFSIDESVTLGLQLVTLLAEQLGARMTIHRSKPTRFELHFPISRSG